MKTDKVKRKKLGTKGLVIAAICCVLTVLVTGASTLWYYFIPQHIDTETLTVPKLVGTNIDNLKTPRGFKIERIYEYSDDIGAGVVLSQRPMAQSRRKIQSGESVTLTVTVSLGKKTDKLPDVRGMQYFSAAIKLRELGAEVLSVPIYDSDKSAGEVLFTDPPANSLIEQGEQVVIYVAKKRFAASVKVPDLTGMDIDEACPKILYIGLKIGNIEYVDDMDNCEKILSQSILPDMYVRHGTYIDIVVGKGLLEDEKNIETQEPESKAPWWRFW